jgi:hypothetical protein
MYAQLKRKLGSKAARRIARFRAEALRDVRRLGPENAALRCHISRLTQEVQG